MPELNCLTPGGRLRHWKKFRESLDSIKEDKKLLLSVIKYWERWPMVMFSLDFDHPETWTTPWEVIHENNLCKSSLAYLMYYTLHLSNPKRWLIKRLKLQLIKSEEIFIALQVDNKYLLNFMLGEAVIIGNESVKYSIISEYKNKKDRFTEILKVKKKKAK